MSKGGESLGPVPGVVALFFGWSCLVQGASSAEGGGPEGEKEGPPPSLSLFSLLALVVSKEREPSITGPVGRMRLI